MCFMKIVKTYDIVVEKKNKTKNKLNFSFFVYSQTSLRVVIIIHNNSVIYIDIYIHSGTVTVFHIWKWTFDPCKDHCKRCILFYRWFWKSVEDQEPLMNVIFSGSQRIIRKGLEKSPMNCTFSSWELDFTLSSAWLFILPRIFDWRTPPTAPLERHWNAFDRTSCHRSDSVVACLKGGHHLERINTLIWPRT